jgi:hypothetical protein
VGDATGCQREYFDLSETGIDSAATQRVPPAVARHYKVVAVRTWGDNLVLAVPESQMAQAKEDLPALLDARLFFCLAHPEQLQAELDRAYAMPA